MKNFIKATRKDVMGSGFTGYLITTYEHLVKYLGEPHDATKEGPWHFGDWKVRAEWAFKIRGKQLTVITIYDYKEIIPVNKVTTWHVGSKGEPKYIDQFFKEKGLSDRTEPMSRGLLF